MHDDPQKALPWTAMMFFAHTHPQFGPERWQRLRDHLRNVSELAAHLATTARPDDPAFIDAARLAGLLHDLGKYRRPFQDMLHDSAAGRPIRKTPHAKYGALHAGVRALDAALSILGHHAGLPSRADFQERYATREAQSELQAALENSLADGFTEIQEPIPRRTGWNKDRMLELDLHIRMLFSCLVDADRLDTAQSQGSPVPESRPLEAQSLLDSLLAHIETRAARVPDGELKQLRGEMLQACLDLASMEGRLFSLPVPTGGGKTFSSMAFALKRASLFPEEIQRVVVVIPFLSIIEQNAADYAEALGAENILEHHSGDLAGLRLRTRDGRPTFEPEDQDEPDQQDPQYRLATENWDAPIVVTTAARFFDSLYSNRPRDLRRMHNLARSIVILDEVQTLPHGFIKTLLSMMEGLAKDWGTQFLFCTATQPAFERLPHSAADPSLSDDPRWAPGTVKSLLPDGLKHRAYTRLARVRDPVWPKPLDIITIEKLASWILERPKALCVVNTKRQAAELFAALRGGTDEGLFHLSTRMCAQHRLDVLEAIRELLGSGDAPCRVVSTQLVEAGVNLDFPTVFRAMAPLDSVIQAAGRCDREGWLTKRAGAPAGELIVFRLDENRAPYFRSLDVTETLINGREVSLHDPDALHRYFDRLYQGDLDPKDIEALRRNLDFPEVARRFSLIQDNTRAVIAPYGLGCELMEQAANAYLVDRRLLRALQRYQVGLYPSEWSAAENLGAIYLLREDLDLWACRTSCYDPALGLVLRRPDDTEFVC